MNKLKMLKRFEVRMEDDLHLKLKKESFKTNKSMQEIVIELIRSHYTKEDK